MNLKPVKLHNNFATAKYSLNASEQKLLIFALRNINQEDKTFIESKFTLMDFSQYANLEITRLYKEIDKMTEKLMSTIIAVQGRKPDKWVRYNLTSKCEYDNGVIMFRFNDEMKTFLLQLKEQFYLQSPGVMKFNSWYSIRIYDLLKSVSYKDNTIEVDIDELKTILDLKDKYERISNFKSRVVEPAVEEINAYSDIEVSYENINTGRTVTGLKFIVKRENKNNNLNIEAIFNTELFKSFIGFEFSPLQVQNLYTIAVNRYTTYENMDDLLLYMKINYDYAKSMEPLNIYSYYKECLINDYGKAINQIAVRYLIELQE